MVFFHSQQLQNLSKLYKILTVETQDDTLESERKRF